MFDKLIESEPEGAEFKNRRSYFMVSSLVVGILFATAVVISIYAADIGLGNSDFELTEMLAPVEMAAAEPEAPEPQRPRSQTQEQVVTRQVNMARVDEFLDRVPDTISTTPNTQRERPKFGDFQIRAVDSEPAGGESGRDTGDFSTVGTGLAISQPPAPVERETDPPPPIVKKDPPPSSKPVSIGVVNGRATHLPKPVYSAAAISIRAQGKVDVQVMIDKTGRVVAANAVSGHPLLRRNAEDAARSARFTPTLLSNVPVTVTGVIVYNFTR